MNKFSNISVALWASALSLLILLSLWQSKITGDGIEYLLCAQAFTEHLSPEIHQEDILSATNLLNKPKFYETMEKAGKERTINGIQYGKGFVKSPNGYLYSWHFWMYPIFVAPFLKVTQWMGMRPAIAFSLCNWFFILGTLSYLLFFWKSSSAQKYLLASLFLLTGTTYYAWWSHPEVFTASLILLSLMMTSDKKYGLAMISSAFAATQNPPVILICIIVAFIATFDNAKKYKDLILWIKMSLIVRKVIPYFLISLTIAFLPIFFFQYVLGVSNPIVACGGANLTLISFDRLWSLFFDLNMGMIVAAPGIFAGVGIVLVISLIKSSGGIWKNFFVTNRVLLACLVSSVIMALPTLSTLNWNHGQSVYSRYAYWLGIPLIYGLVVSIEKIRGNIKIAASILIVCIQLFVVAYYGVTGKNWRSRYSTLKPFSKYIMMKFPRLYNPIPEIFIERLNHKDGIPKPNKAKHHIYAYPSINQPRKLLVARSKVDSIAKQCLPDSIIYSEGEWVYINLPPNSECSLDLINLE